MHPSTGISVFTLDNSIDFEIVTYFVLQIAYSSDLENKTKNKDKNMSVVLYVFHIVCSYAIHCMLIIWYCTVIDCKGYWTPKLTKIGIHEFFICGIALQSIYMWRLFHLKNFQHVKYFDKLSSSVYQEERWHWNLHFFWESLYLKWDSLTKLTVGQNTLKFNSLGQVLLGIPHTTHGFQKVFHKPCGFQASIEYP